MGMTDEQFNSYKRMLLRRLERALKASSDNEELQSLVDDIREELSK